MTDSSWDTPAPQTPDASATVDLPLRGLAGDAADAVAGNLRTLEGVLDASVVLGAFRLRVTYEPTRVDAATIRERLHALVPPDTAHGTAGRPED